MDLDPPPDKLAHICICGRSFIQEGRLYFHQRSCQKAKKRLSGALDKVKDAWKSRKRRRVELVAERKTPSRNLVTESENSSEIDTHVC